MRRAITENIKAFRKNGIISNMRKLNLFSIGVALLQVLWAVLGSAIQEGQKYIRLHSKEIERW